MFLFFVQKKPNSRKIVQAVCKTLVAVGCAFFSVTGNAANVAASTSPSPSPASPKIVVGINPAVDRWITLTDGNRVYEGVEVSYVLGQQLLNSGRFAPVLLTNSTGSSTSVLVSSRSLKAPALSAERLAQIPTQWTEWVNQTQATVLAASATVTGQDFQVPLDITVTPVVETLTYASGARSDQVVYGFSPNHLNPFNQGRAGALDNEFVASTAQQQMCVKPDFFAGQLNVSGWGFLASNFGSNLDEGVSINIAGYGFGFKDKTYQIKSQIRFLVDNHMNGTHQELVFQTTGGGKDIFVAGSYQGFELGVEIQRRNTLIQALQKMLPQVVSDLVSQGFSAVWQSSIIANTAGLVLASGSEEGVTQGMLLTSPLGNVYQVIQVGPTASIIQKVSGSTVPFVGEPLRVYSGQVTNWAPDTTALAPASALVARTAQEKVFSSSLTIPLNTQASAASQTSALSGCFGKSSNWIVNTIDALFTLYAWYRYDHVLDQSLNNPPNQIVVNAPSVNAGLSTSTASMLVSTPASVAISAPGGALKIALIDSGIDYNDSNLKTHALVDQNKQVLGFDFISWDARPSDDNGHGSAAARLLVNSTSKPFFIIPAKVMGPNGETHSSAIYDAFQYAVTSKVDAILVPWASASSTLTAYQMGAQLAASAGIPVFVAANTVAASQYIHVPQSAVTSDYKTKSLGGSSVRLDKVGVATVQELARWINSKN